MCRGLRPRSPTDSAAIGADTRTSLRILRAFARFGTAYAALVAILVLGGAIAAVDRGPLAIAQLLAPHLALACLVLVPIAALARSRPLARTLGIVAMLFGLRFGAEWSSSPEPAAVGSVRLRVATWNLEAGARTGPDAVALLSAHPVDIVALEELTPLVATAIEQDPILKSRYPYRVLSPRDDPAGIGILSRFPISNSETHLNPSLLEASVALEDGTVVVLAAHPFPATIERLLGVPAGLDPVARNADLRLLREHAAELEARGNRVLLIGDLNTAPTEPAFQLLTSGLHDAHADAGSGPGWTWRPGRFAFLGIGLLRIDLVLSTSDFRATGTSIDCPSIGDHCLLEATLAIEH